MIFHINARLQARNYEEHPELAALVAQVPSFTVPGSKDQPPATD